MPRLLQPLPAGPLDVIGDVHGELEALLRLLHRLGVDPERSTASRPVIFVGDLIDRGPDSVGVVELVRRLAEAGIAWCVAGNHELNVLAEDRKEGNGWYWGDPSDHAQVAGQRVPYGSRLATPQEHASIRDFLAELPLALERPDLRVVHACWDATLAARLPIEGDIATLSRAWSQEISADLDARLVGLQARAERAAFAELKDQSVVPSRLLPAVAEEDTALQARNPIKLLTSGAEVPATKLPLDFTGGKWRMAERDLWWERGADRPTIVGHYWRRRGAAIAGKPDPWGGVPTFGWSGGVFCVDYSVGRRYEERALRGRSDGFDGALAAVRWPERTVVFDDRADPIATTGFAFSPADALTLR